MLQQYKTIINIFYLQLGKQIPRRECFFKFVSEESKETNGIIRRGKKRRNETTTDNWHFFLNLQS